MWRNHHATTILNFLVAQIAAMMNLFNFDKSRNCPDAVMKKAFPPSLPPFSKDRLDDASVIFPLSSGPTGLHCILKCQKLVENYTLLCAKSKEFLWNFGNFELIFREFLVNICGNPDRILVVSRSLFGFVSNVFCTSFASALNLRFDLILGGGGWSELMRIVAH